MTEYADLDRFEGDCAILLIGRDRAREVPWPRDLLPVGAREGCELRFQIQVSQPPPPDDGGLFAGARA